MRRLFLAIIGFLERRPFTILIITGLMILGYFMGLGKFIAFMVILSLFLAGFLRFTLVNEGTAKAFMRLGALKKTAGEWRGHIVDRDTGEVADLPMGTEQGKSLLGGLYFVGFWPLDKVYKYDFEYSKFEVVGGKLRLVPRNLSGKNAIDYILIRPDTFGIEIDEAETMPEERIPVNIMLNVSVRVKNVQKALFKAPTNWWRKLEARLIALFRGWTTTVTVDEVLGLKGRPEEVWRIINEQSPNLVDNVEDEWGIIIEENKVEIRDISFPADVQSALKARKQLELEAEANLRKQEVDAKSTASATLGRLMESLSQGSGVDVNDLQAELRTAMAEPDLKERAKKVRAFWGAYDPDGRIWNLIQSERLGAKVVLVGTPGGKAADPLTTLLATYMTLKEGGGAGGGRNLGGNQGGQSSQGGKSPEEAAQEFFDKNGIWPRWDPLNRGGYKK
ncbi:MAG: hypothetical protein HYT36_01345 [Candidatus Staskawiczbacteria bacterium]|nr:hypothetical protein [Candidatus Staskawiczbacteria bacterium]